MQLFKSHLGDGQRDPKRPPAAGEGHRLCGSHRLRRWSGWFRTVLRSEPFCAVRIAGRRWDFFPYIPVTKWTKWSISERKKISKVCLILLFVVYLVNFYTQKKQ